MPGPADRLSVLRANPFFGALSEEDLGALAPLLRDVSIAAGEFLVREGDPAHEVFVIETGEVSVLKRDPMDEIPREITRLGAGESIGELALLDDGPRSASVRALRATRLWVLSVDDIGRDQQRHLSLRSRLAQAVTRRLRDATEVTARALALQVAMGRFLTFIIVLLTLYAYLLSGFSRVAALSGSTTPFTLVLMLVLIGSALTMMRKMGYPLSFYGLTRAGWQRAAVEAVVWTVPACALVLGLKWVLVRVVAGDPSAPLLDPSAALNLGAIAPGQRVTMLAAMAALYAVHAPLQEFLVRGCLQSPLQRFLVNARGPWLAIVGSNLIFSAFHLWLSLGFAVLTFVPGLFWGWLFARQGTLVGVTISHILLGIWAIFVVGIEGVVR